MTADLVTFAKAMSDETRQEILRHLCCCTLTVNEVVEKLDGRVNQPTVSHHLKVLAEANLVQVEQDGRQRLYTLNQQQLTLCCGQLMIRFAPDFASQIIPPDQIQ